MDMKISTFENRLKCYRELNKRNKDFVNIDLYKLVFKEDALVAGYEKIKSKNGATTPGIGSFSLDGFKRLRKLSSSLRNESWKPLPARRVYIPNPGKSEKRPLAIQGPEEKVVQAVMLLILESIYEPIFLKTSFGFRPKLGTHDALKVIGQKYDGMTFAIEGNIKGMYDNVNHNILVKLLEKRIQDDRFIRLVRKMLGAGYLEVGKQLIRPDLGTPQGSIISPILANIYLHELDLFMSDRVLDLTQRNEKSRTPSYRDIDNRMRVVKSRLKEGKFSDKSRDEYLKERKYLNFSSLRVRMYCNPCDRIFYTRYADDFIVGFAGSEELANQVKEQIRTFLTTLDLVLSPEKSKVTNLRKSYAFFLGHRIRIDTAVKIAMVRPKGKTPYLNYLKRVTGSLVSIEAPINRIVQRLAVKGFCDHKGFPTHKKLWVSQDDHQIIQNFNATIRGIFGYYSGANKRHYLQRIWYLLRFSCAYTLAARHGCSLNKVYSKHGKLLRVNYGVSGEKSVSLFEPSLRKAGRKWQTGRVLEDPS